MLDTICDVLKKAYDRNLISTRDGNASYRRKDEDYLYVTPSGVRKQLLNSEMIIKLKINREEDKLERVMDEYQSKITGLEPSGELLLHYYLQKNLKENRVVLHLHPTYIVAAMYKGISLQEIAKEFPEINRYTRVGPTVPIIEPISKKLADASIKAFNLSETGDIDYDIIGLDRHGIVAIGKDAWSAYEHVERLEHICQMVLASNK